METRIVEGKEYIVKEIEGHGTCLVPKPIPEKEKLVLKNGSFLSYDGGKQIGKVINHNRKWFVIELKTHNHIWYDEEQETATKLADRLTNYWGARVEVVTREEAFLLLK